MNEDSVDEDLPKEMNFEGAADDDDENAEGNEIDDENDADNKDDGADDYEGKNLPESYNDVLVDNFSRISNRSSNWFITSELLLIVSSNSTNLLPNICN